MHVKQVCTAPNCHQALGEGKYCQRKARWRTWHEEFVYRGAYLCGRCFSERKGRGRVTIFPLFRSKHVRPDTVVIGKETDEKTIPLQLVNTTERPITFISGDKTLVLEPNKDIVVKTVEEKQIVCRVDIDGVNIPFQSIVCRVLGLPQSIPGTFFIVDEEIARAVGRQDLLSPGEPVLDDSGNVIGFSGLRIAPSENEDVRELVLTKNKLTSEIGSVKKRAEDSQSIMSDCLTTLGENDQKLEKCRAAIRPVVEQGSLNQCPMHNRRSCPECCEIVTLTYAEMYALRQACDDGTIEVVSEEVIPVEDLPLPMEGV